MFTGIVQAVGRVETVAPLADGSGGISVRFSAPGPQWGRLPVGASVAVSGCCLTATRIEPDGFHADLSAETLACTTLGGLGPGSAVNLEPAMRAEDALGGHLVTGHVDARGHLRESHADGECRRMRFGLPTGLARYVARKGSVCVDGVSLTVNAVDVESFEVTLIPHTLAVTTLGALAQGGAVNLEVDIVARYLERLLQAHGTPAVAAEAGSGA